MSDSLTLALKFRQALLRREAAAQEEIIRAYEGIWKDLTIEIERVAGKLQAGGNSPSLLFEQGRLKELQDQLAIEISDVAQKAGAITTREQAQFVELARAHSVRLMEAGANEIKAIRVNFASLAKDELRHLVGVMQDASSVAGAFRKLGQQIGLDSAEPVKRALLRGMALGSNPRQIAAAVRREVDVGFQPGRVTRSDPRAVRLLNMGIREQVMGAYREASRLTYDENKKLLGGWAWTAKRSATTCIICWAMDGQVFPADAPLVSHVSCHCVMRPLLPGQDSGETGPDAFNKLERGVQKEILGDLAFNAYDSGMVQLKDFVGTGSDMRWGDFRFRRGLEDIIGKSTVQKMRLRASRQ